MTPEGKGNQRRRSGGNPWRRGKLEGKPGNSPEKSRSIGHRGRPISIKGGGGARAAS